MSNIINKESENMKRKIKIGNGELCIHVVNNTIWISNYTDHEVILWSEKITIGISKDNNVS